MTVFKRYSYNLLMAFLVVAMMVIWLIFAPTQAGGMASYIIVIGNSMEPNFHIGDLVIVHKEPDYQIGDAVVYRNLELGSFVFHRIIAEEMGRFDLKGDNNSWTDTYQPSYEEIMGKLWLRVARGGIIIQKVRAPINMALIAGLVGGVLAISLFKGKSKGNKYMNKKSIQEWLASLIHKTRGWFAKAKNPEPQKSSNPYQGNLVEGSFFVLGLVACATLILGIIAYSRPSSRMVEDSINYEHLGFFAYTSSAPQGIYDSNAIKSGDPIFPKLTCSIDLTFQYTLVGGQAENVAGTYQLTATISEQASGWQRTVPLQMETPFNGNIVATSAKLNLCQMESLAQSLEEGTDFHPGVYTLTVTPNIRVEGDISGRVLQTTFNPGLAFGYDRIHFYLIKDEERGSPLNMTETGVLREERTEANTILLLGSEIAIPTLRLITLIGFVLSLGGITILVMKLQNISRGDQVQFIRMKYGSMMIDIQNATSLNSSNIINVTSIDDLAKLAERFNTMILHAKDSDSHEFYVQGERITYQFTMDANMMGSIVPENQTDEQGGGS